MRLPVVPANPADVAERQLCCGCGACAFASPARIEMVDTLDGRRPRYRDGTAPGAPHHDAMAVCPGMGQTSEPLERGRPAHPGLIASLARDWGPVLEVWEGWATDPKVRRLASSGGAATAIALAAIEAGGMHGALHIRARRDAPLFNETVLSTTRAEMLAATGSRYAPASPCDRLDLVESAPGPCVFIGKPCDAAAVHKAIRVRPALKGRVGVTIAMFCAGTPTTAATLRLLAHLGVNDPGDVLDLRYRGDGWPGELAATVRTSEGTVRRTLPYEAAWGALSQSKQWRCHLCADHSGELADISVGDPWHRPVEPGDHGRSLILVRTERGRRVLRDAREAGYLEIARAEPSVVSGAQPSLRRARAAVWGRLLACRILGLPAPRYPGLPLFAAWWSALGAADRFRSIAGLARRARSRRLRKRIPVVPLARPETTATSAEMPRRWAA